MPKLAATLEVSTTREIRIEPKLRQRLVKELRAYAALKDQLDTIQHAMDGKKAVIGKMREETDEQSVKVEGFTVTMVAPIKHSFDAKLFVNNGGDIAIYNQSFVDTPTRPYEKITCPGRAKDTHD